MQVIKQQLGGLGAIKIIMKYLAREKFLSWTCKSNQMRMNFLMENDMAQIHPFMIIIAQYTTLLG